uniref:Uncharacterized protein n=1 Tax=Anguilla anguilla TaxID=7936 RepID=A0A0E9TFC0_ANGAN
MNSQGARVNNSAFGDAGKCISHH